MLRLTLDTLDEEIKLQNLLLVNYYAPWCGYCQTLQAVLDEVAQTLSESNVQVAIKNIYLILVVDV